MSLTKAAREFLQHFLQLFPDTIADCHNDTMPVNIGTADAGHLVRRPAHDLGDVLVGQAGEDQLGAKRSSQVMQVLATFLAGVVVNVNDAGGVPDPVETAAQPVTRPWSPVAIDQDRFHARLSRPGAKLVEQRPDRWKQRHGHNPPPVPAGLERPLDQGGRVNLVPGQRHQILAAQAR